MGLREINQYGRYVLIEIGIDTVRTGGNQPDADPLGTAANCLGIDLFDLHQRDPTAEDAADRQRGIDYLLECVR